MNATLMLNHGLILKRAWEIARSERALWGLAILSGFAGGSANFQMPFPGDSVPESSQVTEQFSTVADQTYDWLNNHLGVVVAVAVLLVALSIFCIYVASTARAALILGVAQLEGGGESHHRTGERLRFRALFRAGRPFAWRVFALKLVLGLSFLAYFLVAAAPLGVGIYRAFQAGATWETLNVGGLIFSIVTFILLVAVGAIYLALLTPLSERGLVLEAVGVRSALRQAHQLLIHFLPQVGLTWLIQICVGFVAMLLIVAALAVAGAVFLLIGSLAYFAASTVAMVPVVVIGVLVAVVGVIILSAILATFLSAQWTLTYRALAYLGRSRNQ